MSLSVQFNNVTYLSSKEAGRISGYTSDYIARLARQGKVEATRVGSQWFVEPKSLEQFLQFAEIAKTQRKSELRSARLSEREQNTEVTTAERYLQTHDTFLVSAAAASPVKSHAVALAVVTLGFLGAILFSMPQTTLQRIGYYVSNETRLVAYGFYQLITATTGSSLLSAISGHSVTVDSEEALYESSVMREINGGLVILPRDVASSTIEYVSDSFSDEVSVALDPSGQSGVVTPHFADGQGDSYRFVLVPLRAPP